LLNVEGIDYFTGEVMEAEYYDTAEMPTLRKHLENISNSYWADKMMDWVERHTNA